MEGYIKGRPFKAPAVPGSETEGSSSSAGSGTRLRDGGRAGCGENLNRFRDGSGCFGELAEIFEAGGKIAADPEHHKEVHVTGPGPCGGLPAGDPEDAGLVRGDFLKGNCALEEPAIIHAEGVGDADAIVTLGHVEDAGVAAGAPMLGGAGAGERAVVMVLDLLALAPRGPAGPVSQVIDEREDMGAIGVDKDTAGDPRPPGNEKGDKAQRHRERSEPDTGFIHGMLDCGIGHGAGSARRQLVHDGVADGMGEGGPCGDLPKGARAAQANAGTVGGADADAGRGNGEMGGRRGRRHFFEGLISAENMANHKPSARTR